MTTRYLDDAIDIDFLMADLASDPCERTDELVMPLEVIESRFQSDTPIENSWPQPRRLTQEDPTLRIPYESIPWDALAHGAILEDIIAVVPMAIVAIGNDGHVRFWSAAATSLFGWTSEEVIGNLPPFLPADLQMEHHRFLAEARIGTRIRDVATVRRTKSNRRIPVIASASADASGAIVFVFRAAENEPKAIASERETTHDTDDRSRTYETLGRMLAGVVHDFHNVLSVIGGNAELIAEQVPECEPVRSHAEVIRAAVRYATNLSKRLLAFTEPNRSEPAAVDISHVVAGLEVLVQATVGSSIRCQFHLANELPLIWVEPSRVEQIAMNLVAGAHDAMTSGGQLEIRTNTVTIRAGRRGWPEDLTAGAYACLTIADTGAHTDDASMVRMFETENRTESALATVREIVRQFRGHVEVESQPDVGSITRVYFPAIPTSDDHTDPMIELPVASSGDTILLATTDAAARESAKECLEAIGYNVVVAASVDDALRLLKSERSAIHAAVVDCVLPGGGGHRLIERIRTIDNGIRFVMLSKYPLDSKELPRGVACVQKPFPAHHLLAAVWQVLRTSVLA